MAANSILAKMSVLISAQNAEFNRALKQSTGSLNSFTSNVTKIAGAVGIAFGIKEVAGFAFEVSKLAGEAEGVRAAFERLPESQKLMERLKNATHDTVSELDLMKRSVQAANFGISLQALPKLLEFASLRAQQTGQSVDYLVDSIITGIGRKSPLILDNLGISAVALKDKMNGVSIATASVGDVADAVGKIAADSLGTMGEFSDNASTKVQQLNAAWENFKVVIGESANGTGLLGQVLSTLTATLERLSGDTKRNTKDWSDTLAQAIKGNVSNLDNFIAELVKLRKEAGAPLQFNIDELIEKYKLSGDQADRLTNAIIQVNNSLSDQERRIKIFKDFARGYDNVRKAAEDFKDIQYQNILQAQIEQAQIEKYTPELKKAIEQQKVKIKVYRDLINTANEFLATQTQETANLVQQTGLIEGLEAQLKEFEEGKKAAFSESEIVRFNQRIEQTKAQLDALNASRPLSGFGREQLANAQSGQKTTVDDPAQVNKSGQNFLADIGGVADTQASLIESANQRIVDSQNLVIDSFNRSAAGKRAEAEAMGIAHDQMLEKYGQSIEMAQQYGEAVGNAVASVVSGQQSGVQALKQLTGQLLQMFLKQAIGGMAARAMQTPGPPPVALAAMAAGAAVLTALFSRLGASGGGGGSSRGMASAGARSAADSGGRLSGKGFEITVGGELVIEGDNIRYIINRNNQKNERRRG